MTAPAAVCGPAEALESIRKALSEASRAPSAHNTQPARWTADAEGRVVLLEDLSRWLSAGDPTRRDHELSLGAAWEGLDLALGRWRLALGDPEPLHRETGPGVRPFARAHLVPWGGADPLADAVPRRRTWRGRFPSPSAATRRALTRALAPFTGTARIDDRAGVTRLARLYDRCLVDALTGPDVLRELRSWMRLSSPEVRSTKDGLTAPTLLVPTAAATLVGSLLRPRPFAALRALGLARRTVSEARATRSAAAVVILGRRPDESLLACGRRLYRVWLGLTMEGLAACPMSALLDVDEGREAVRDLALEDGPLPFAVLRVGPAPAKRIPESPRLPPDLLLVRPGGLP